MKLSALGCRFVHSEARMRPVVKRNLEQAFAKSKKADAAASAARKAATFQRSNPEQQNQLVTPVWEAFNNEAVSKIRNPPKSEINSPKDSKLLRVAIIGLKLSGKSSLMNNLIGRHVSAVSKRAYSTRKWTMGIHTIRNTQILFLDTPSIRVTYTLPERRTELNDKIIEKDLISSEASWDAVVHSEAVIVAVPCYQGLLAAQQIKLLQALKERLIEQGTPNKPVYVAITMTDRNELRNNVKPLIRDLIKQSPISLKGIGAVGRNKHHSYATMTSLLLKEALPSPWSYPSAFTTNQTSPELVEQLALEAILSEVQPHSDGYFISAKVVGWTLGDCPPQGKQPLVINILYTFGSSVLAGVCRDNIKKITEDCRRKAINAFHNKYQFTIRISVAQESPQDWDWGNPYGHFKPSYIAQSTSEVISQVYDSPFDDDDDNEL
eukprot:TRINITY_DN4797_c1_g1_i1.p1 TRINITY_DN4797_c1_g1~~TRINITY_DN4797_c1_g1_i1.p1  ORF type:complete len:460 (+),score=82.25 TRINITY_DN4797_c1_g1_i1:73-1380(+)